MKTASLLLLPFVFLAPNVAASYRHRSMLTAESVPTTGINDFCGTPIWLFPFSGDGNPSPDFRFDLIQEYDTVGSGTLLTSTNCNSDAVLATYSNPSFNAFRGLPDPHTNLQNVPLHELSTVVGFNGARGNIPSIEEASPIEPHLVATNAPITLGEWAKASGTLSIVCSKDGRTSTAELEFERLVPNGVYTIFGLYRTPTGGLSPSVVPFGGHPNVFVVDEDGRASFFRSFTHCLLDPVAGGHELLFIEINYRVDGIPQGAVPVVAAQVADFDVDEDGNPAYSSALALGVTEVNHLLFPVHEGIEVNEDVATLSCHGKRRRKKQPRL